MAVTKQQRKAVENLAKRGRGKAPYICPEKSEDLWWAERISWRAATDDQKRQVAEILELPVESYLIRTLSKGTANQVIRDARAEEETCNTE